jgi:hypothetical protein
MASSGNFSTMNPLHKTSTNVVYSNGNMTFSPGSSWSQTTFTRNNMVIPKDKKIYFEVYFKNQSGHYAMYGVSADKAIPTSSESGSTGTIILYNGSTRINGTRTDGVVTNPSQGDVVSIAIDGSNNKVWTAVNNTWQLSGDPANGTNEIGTITTNSTVGTDITAVFNQNSVSILTVNFGQDSTFAGEITAGGNADGNGFGDFKYAPPTGFLALCSGNLSVSADIDPAQDTGPTKHFDVVTYTGNGGTQSITSLGFQPDWTLIKNRSTGDWCNQNSSLGVGKSQKWNDDGGVSSDTDAVTSFNSDGFSLGADSKVNTNSANYVAYCWKKSAEAGLDIVTYSGSGGSQAVSHSLGATPDCIFIMLNTGSALDSIMYLNSTSMGTSYGIFPTLANARQNSTYVSATSSSNFTVTSSADTSGRTYFAYVLKSIEGFSRFGQYYANANSNGPFAYLGFRPRLIIIKALESGQTWFFFDTARSTYNPIDLYLYGQRDLAESTAGSIDIDFLSNGFKIRSSGSDLNSSSGQAYAYLAWADVPFKYNNTF